MNLHSIKFAVEVDARLLNPDHSHAVDIKGHKVLDWGLGKGPCGRWVGKLYAEIDMATVRVTQESYSSDRSDDIALVDSWGGLGHFSPKQRISHMGAMIDIQRQLHEDRKVETFIYKLEDVRGRIKAVQKG